MIEEPITPANENPAPIHKRKNWRIYFWEFTMLFLAVFCGFLAQYQLEHIIDKENEEELAASFYTELKGDSVALQTAIANRRRKDASFTYLKKYFRDSSVTQCSKAFTINFYYTFSTYSPSIFEPNDAIINQLRFNNPELQKLTGRLSVLISNLKKRNEMEWTYVHEVINPFFIKHNDQRWTDEISKDSSEFMFITLQKYENASEQIPFQFQKADQLDRIEAVNIVGLYQTTFRGTLQKQYHDYEMLNAKLLAALRKEYEIQ